MAFLRPSFTLPGRYIRCFLFSGTALDNVHIAAWHAPLSDEETDCHLAVGIDGPPGMAARPAAAPWQHGVHGGRAAGQEWHHAYHTRSSPLPLSGVHGGVVQPDDDAMRLGGSEARSRTAAQGPLRIVFAKPPGWPALGGVRTHMGHSHNHAAHEPVTSEGEKVVRLGFWSDIGLTIGKARGNLHTGSALRFFHQAHIRANFWPRQSCEGLPALLRSPPYREDSDSLWPSELRPTLCVARQGRATCLAPRPCWRTPPTPSPTSPSAESAGGRTAPQPCPRTKSTPMVSHKTGLPLITRLQGTSKGLRTHRLNVGAMGVWA